MSGPAAPGRAGGGRAAPSRQARREADLRVARLHLRVGMHALARVELETMAGRDGLDRDAIMELAEVRWRTGDLAGAAVAAAAWLEDGEDVGAPGVLAHVITAEAAAARGALEVAAAHVDAAAGRIGDARSLDALLAGIPTRAPWPSGEVAVLAPGPADEAASAVPEPQTEPVVLAVASPPEAVPAALPPPPSPAPPTPPSRAADLVAAGAALVAAAPARAAIVFALALRADAAAAEAVLDALDAAAPEPAPGAALAFVRAQALEAAGRHDEARIAYASAERLALAPAEPGTPRSPQ